MKFDKLKDGDRFTVYSSGGHSIIYTKIRPFGKDGNGDAFNLCAETENAIYFYHLDRDVEVSIKNDDSI